MAAGRRRRNGPGARSLPAFRLAPGGANRQAYRGLPGSLRALPGRGSTRLGRSRGAAVRFERRRVQASQRAANPMVRGFHPRPGAVLLPLAEVAVDGSPVREIVGQHPPGTSAATAVEDRVDHGAHRRSPIGADGAAGGNVLANRFPLGVGQVARIAWHRSVHGAARRPYVRRIGKRGGILARNSGGWKGIPSAPKGVELTMTAVGVAIGKAGGANRGDGAAASPASGSPGHRPPETGFPISAYTRWAGVGFEAFGPAARIPVSRRPLAGAPGAT